MIPYINSLLEQWGQWSMTGREKIGYPSRAAFMRLVPSKEAAQVTICDDEAMRINRAVQTLEREAREVVDLFYIKMRRCEVKAIAKSLCCHRDTVYARLHRAHVRVMEALQDEATEEPAVPARKIS